jgi:hypothetical protein
MKATKYGFGERMGSLFKTKATPIYDQSAVDAWNTVKPYHQTAMSGMQGVANNLAQNPAYSGQRVADLNQYQTGGANTLGSFAGNTADNAYGMTNVGQNNLMAGNAFGGNAGDIYNRSTMDPTQQIIGNAGMYANNPYMDGMIDAANRDTVRGLTEQQLPSLMRGMVGSGNTNNTAGMKEGQILARGAMDRMADTSANLRGQFFGKGLDMAQGQWNQNIANMLNSNQGLLNAGQFGLGAMGAGQQYAGNAFNQSQAAGGLFYDQQQRQFDAQRDVFNESWQNPLSAYGALSGAAGNVQQPKTVAGINQQPSVMSQLAAAGQAAASGYGAFKTSDIRAKENIKHIGELASGLKVYEFEYKPEFKGKAGFGRFIGVMAQETAEVFPEAVMTDDDGYLMVDYSRIG